MRKTLLALGALAALAWLPSPAVHAQGAGVSELVVTAERREEGPPHVGLIHRADFLAVEVQVDCDTRDQRDRLEEMKSTLRNMIAASAAAGVELGVENDDVVLPLKPDALETLLSPGRQPDTTTTTILVKTHLTPDDTFEAATARVDRYLRATKVVGRALASRTGDWQLTLIRPEQYHAQIVSAVAQDAADTSKAFGAGFSVEIQGLERSVQWMRAGPLDLALYIPYSLKVEPLPARP